MITEDYVPFELARKLKEKGFLQNTVGLCEANGATYFMDGRFYKDGCIADVDECYSAPTIWQVLKWFREEKKLHLTMDMGFQSWFFEVYEILDLEKHTQLSRTLHTDVEDRESYEEATLAGIEYVLDNLI